LIQNWKCENDVVISTHFRFAANRTDKQVMLCVLAKRAACVLFTVLPDELNRRSLAEMCRLAMLMAKILLEFLVDQEKLINFF